VCTTQASRRRKCLAYKARKSVTFGLKIHVSLVRFRPWAPENEQRRGSQDFAPFSFAPPTPSRAKLHGVSTRLVLLTCCALACEGEAERSTPAPPADAAPLPADAAPPPADAAPAPTPARVVTDSPTFLRGEPTDPWWPGDVHVHATGASNDTGGDSPPAEIARVARARGLAFVVLTDHSNSTGSDVDTTDEDPARFNQGPEFPYWDEAARLTVPGELLMIDGNELSPVSDEPRIIEPRGHIGCLPGDLLTFDRAGAIVDRPRGEVSGGDALAQARDRGCFTVVNHPYGLAPWIMYDWTDRGYDALEVWNGGNGFDAADEAAWQAWRCDLLAGESTTPIGASDNHRVLREPPGEVLHPALGWPSTSVRAPTLTWPEVIAAMRRGDVALHEGESRVFIEGYDASGVWSRGGPWSWIRIHGRLDPAAGQSRLRLSRATACEDPRPSTVAPTVTDTPLLERTLEPGADFDVAVPVEPTDPGVFAATLLRSLPSHYGALSRGLVQPSAGSPR